MAASDLKPKKKGEKPSRTGPQELSVKQREFLAEYLKVKNATAAYRRVYGRKKNPETERSSAYIVKHTPSMQKALHDAMAKMEIDEEFAVGRLKKVITSGDANLGDTQAKDVLKALEMFFKLKGHLAGGNKTPEEEEAKQLQGMTVDQIAQELKELDKKQDRLLTIMGRAEEGVVIEDKHK